jgi:hypothetical protein
MADIKSTGVIQALCHSDAIDHAMLSTGNLSLG